MKILTYILLLLSFSLVLRYEYLVSYLDMQSLFHLFGSVALVFSVLMVILLYLVYYLHLCGRITSSINMVLIRIVVSFLIISFTVNYDYDILVYDDVLVFFSTFILILVVVMGQSITSYLMTKIIQYEKKHGREPPSNVPEDHIEMFGYHAVLIIFCITPLIANLVHPPN